ncbi:LANO_0A02124g1_1 [Lachancea nothofagi CBS 11611]|uniref:LANO_0A02124g1_1 n=1 Tax=Lachancea nothofagi CBS 11611 TaxID=1266666 RepID=A0A1G4INB6_9SACH|nr:LANO_0A02124g1_1 [Lachancea nothofagi CBS 11611]
MAGELNPSYQSVWRKDSFVVSTNRALIPVSTLNDWFASDHVYWTNALPERVLQEALDNSLCFGLYDLGDECDSFIDSPTDKIDAARFIGFARCVTDYSTLFFLTDVHVVPAYQGKGLGRWLVSCVQEVIDSAHNLRRSLLLTSDWERSVPFYEDIMGMTVLESTKEKKGPGLAFLHRPGKK